MKELLASLLLLESKLQKKIPSSPNLGGALFCLSDFLVGSADTFLGDLDLPLLVVLSLIIVKLKVTKGKLDR